MTASIAWIHVGDLHADEADDWKGITQLREIVAGIASHAIAADFLFLPGDNANHGTPGQYARIIAALQPLPITWHAIPGDHDFEPGNLIAYEAAIPAAHRPASTVIAGHRCIFLDIVSVGAGGPDFRLTMGERRRLAEELARAEADGTPPLVFMHAYPGDLAADGAEIAQCIADGGVTLVDTGHTHYNELLNDGRVIYAATRSTAQIEEDDGRAGIATICVQEGVPSWRFRRLPRPWPAIQIVSPCDLRLVTRPADVRHVPRPGPVRIVARAFGAVSPPVVRIPGRATIPMEAQPGNLWGATLPLDAGLTQVVVEAGAGVTDAIQVLVRGADALPKRGPPRALGEALHAIGCWPEAGILGTQLGPNRNGGEPS